MWTGSEEIHNEWGYVEADFSPLGPSLSCNGVGTAQILESETGAFSLKSRVTSTLTGTHFLIVRGEEWHLLWPGGRR